MLHKSTTIILFSGELGGGEGVSELYRERVIIVSV